MNKLWVKLPSGHFTVLYLGKNPHSSILAFSKHHHLDQHQREKLLQRYSVDVIQRSNVSADPQSFEFSGGPSEIQFLDGEEEIQENQQISFTSSRQKNSAPSNKKTYQLAQQLLQPPELPELENKQLFQEEAPPQPSQRIPKPIAAAYKASPLINTNTIADKQDTSPQIQDIIKQMSSSIRYLPRLVMQRRTPKIIPQQLARANFLKPTSSSKSKSKKNESSCQSSKRKSSPGQQSKEVFRFLYEEAFEKRKKLDQMIQLFNQTQHQSFIQAKKEIADKRRKDQQFKEKIFKDKFNRQPCSTKYPSQQMEQCSFQPIITPYQLTPRSRKLSPAALTSTYREMLYGKERKYN